MEVDDVWLGSQATFGWFSCVPRFVIFQRLALRVRVVQRVGTPRSIEYYSTPHDHPRRFSFISGLTFTSTASTLDLTLYHPPLHPLTHLSPPPRVTPHHHPHLPTKKNRPTQISDLNNLEKHKHKAPTTNHTPRRDGQYHLWTDHLWIDME